MSPHRSVTHYAESFAQRTYDPAMQHRAQPTERADKVAPNAQPLAQRRPERLRLVEEQPDTFVKPLPVPEHFPIT
jgi:hypothetical protein